MLCNAVFRSRLLNFQTGGGTFRGTLSKAISTLLLPKRPLSKCSFYRLITLAGTMHCGDTQTSAEVFIFNIVAPTPSDAGSSASVWFIPIFGKENFYYKTVQRLPIFSFFVQFLAPKLRLYCPKMGFKYYCQSSEGPELVPKMILG